nr:polysaccharide deacetylase family protein [Metabacillus mangrovi]
MNWTRTEKVESIRKNTVFLTFDDGPSASTDELLQVLDQHKAPATFFMLEPNMRKHRKEVLKTIQLGHAAGLHGVTHNPDLYYASPESATGEMKTANDTLQKLTGVSTGIVRTPYGSKPNLTEPEQEALLAEGFQYWDWNVDSLDWKHSTPDFVSNVLEQTEKRTKDFPEEPIVILMHDRPVTPEAVDQLIPKLKERGYSFASIQEEMIPVHLQ